MTHPARIVEKVWLHPKHVSPRDLAAIRERLTYTPKVFDQGEQPEPIEVYEITGDGEVGVPLDFGMRIVLARGLPVKDETTAGVGIDVPKRPSAREDIAGQTEFFDALLASLADHRALLVQAATGKGKTVAGCLCIAERKCATLVIVPTSAVLEQWSDELKRHNGFSSEQVGMVGDGACRWKGCSVVVMLLNSAADKAMPPEFFRMFGLVIFDEAHRLGARTFSRAMSRFPAARRIAMTATPDRKDGCMGMVMAAFGKPRVVCDGEALRCHVKTISFTSGYWNMPPAALPLSVLLNILSRNKARNAMLARGIASLYADKRNVLAMGDRLDQLDVICELLVHEHKIPRTDIGIFTSSTAKADKARIRRDSRIILGTYSLLREAVDIPRMDAGVELTPRAEAIQSIGRIRRPHPNKRTPLWITVLDKDVPMLKAFHAKRCNAWEACNCKLL